MTTKITSKQEQATITISLKIRLCTPTNYVLMGIMLQKLSMNAVFVRLYHFLVQDGAFECLIEKKNGDGLVSIGVLNISGDERQI